MNPNVTTSLCTAAKTIVLKLGSAVLTTPEGHIDMPVLQGLCDEVAELQRQGRQIIIVSSGAVAAGRGALGIAATRRPTISEKQALAAVGQSRLMQIYSDFFSKHGIVVGQMLLTRSDMDDRRRYVNARYTLEELLRRKCVPIINENDTVTVDELKFGDNDGLAALVAVKMQADALILLSDVQGLFDSNPKENPDAKLIDVLEKVSSATIEQFCPSTHEGLVGSGGMRSKLVAARLATSQGVWTSIAHGKTAGQLTALLAGKQTGTFFPAGGCRQTRRRQWILTGKTSGRRIQIDDGATKALIENHKSLLPAGIRFVEGSFHQGELVEIADLSGRLLARGIVNYSSNELKLIQGHKTGDIESILGFKPHDEAVHRDNLALIE